jgi:hypothetical protein
LRGSPPAIFLSALGHLLVDDHTALDRLLHRLVLENGSVAELLFDLESGVFGNAAPRRDAVYVTGLARCGSTALLRSLHSSGDFASLTYRDMPFVVAPNLWRRMVGFRLRKAEPRERPHGDGIVEDLDSPEGLEEVFWRKELGDTYIGKDFLSVHKVPVATLKRLKVYQSVICARHGLPRYLAKNNNLVLRLRSLAPQTPDTCYFVLFRHPLAHADSLLRQHQRFSDTSGFVQDYMRWLVHHEFGAGHRPFRFPKNMSTDLLPNEIDYWLERWIDAYSFLVDVLKQNPNNTVAVHYERLCDDQSYRAAVFARAGVVSGGAMLQNRNRTGQMGSGSLIERAAGVYSVLCDLAARRN